MTADTQRTPCVILGAPRSGTTSLWRYLANHPDIAASRVKEYNFFAQDDYAERDYAEGFASGGRATLEASPIYFHEHAWIAPRIGPALPDARLVCVLREPARRLVAAYRSERDWHNRVAPDMTFARYAEIVASGEDPTPIKPDDPKAAAYVRDCSLAGNYADVIGHYLESYRPDQLQIHFLDTLKDDPARVVMACLDHFGLDPEEFPEITYAVENQGVNVRNLQLFQALRRVNAKLEPVLNKVPRLRAYLKRVHQAVNGAPQDLHAADEARGVATLKKWYAPANRRFSAMLDELYPQLEQPEWLRSARAPEQAG